MLRRLWAVKLKIKATLAYAEVSAGAGLRLTKVSAGAGLRLTKR